MPILFFQAITAAWKDDRKRKLSAGIAIAVRQRTVFYENKRLSATESFAMNKAE